MKNKTSLINQSIQRPNASTLQRTTMIATALALILGPGIVLAQRPLGIDVSDNNGSGINWSSVKSSGVTYAWAKATEGGSVIDGDFTSNESNGKAAGLYMGAYHFAHPDDNSPGTEAGWFWGEAGGYVKADGKTIMPTLDFETFSGLVGASSYSAWANSWCDTIVNDAGANNVTIRPVIYSTTCEACNLNGSVSQWISWMANPSGESAQSGSPWDYTTCDSCDIWGSGVWDLWQYSWTASIPGISGAVDADVFNGSTSDMVKTLVINGAAPTPGYHSFVGPIEQDPNGSLEMFGVGSNSDIWHNYQSGANQNWVGWFDQANPRSVAGPAASHTQNGCLQVFVSSQSGKIWHNYQNTPGGSWNGWVSQGGVGITNLVALTNLDGRVEVFGIGTNSDVWHEWETTVNGGWTTSWSDITGEHIQAGMVGIINLSGTLELFGVGSNGHVWHNWQSSPGQAFNGWADSGGSGLNPRLAIARNADGRLEVFAVDSSGNVWHNWQTSPGQVLNGWVEMNGSPGIKPGFIVAINKDGRLELFGVGSNNDVWHVWQNEPGSNWHSWSDLGGSGQNAQLMAANNENGELQLFDIGNNSEDVWSIYQNSPGGSWNSWFDMGGNGMQFFYGQP